MKITTEQFVILLRATEGHPERFLDMGYGNGELLDTPGNQWAIDLINSARRKVHAYGSLEGLTMCGIHERELPPQYTDYLPPRRATKDRDADVTCPACLERLY